MSFGNSLHIIITDGPERSSEQLIDQVVAALGRQLPSNMLFWDQELGLRLEPFVKLLSTISLTDSVETIATAIKVVAVADNTESARKWMAMVSQFLEEGDLRPRMRARLALGFVLALCESIKLGADSNACWLDWADHLKTMIVSSSLGGIEARNELDRLGSGERLFKRTLDSGLCDLVNRLYESDPAKTLEGLGEIMTAAAQYTQSGGNSLLLADYLVRRLGTLYVGKMPEKMLLQRLA